MKAFLAVAAAGLAFFVACQDGQIVISALPVLARDLNVDNATAIWLMIAAAVLTVGLMLPVGRWADASGNRAGFAIGAGGYALSAVLATASPNFLWLLVARALEGAFCALLMVLVITVAVEAAGPGRRALAVGAVTAVGSLGNMTGPQLVAVLLPLAGWRSIFAVAIPLATLSALLGWISIPGPAELARVNYRWLLEAITLTVAVGSFFLLLREIPLGAAALPLVVGLALLTLAGLAAWTRLPQAHGIFRLVAARRLRLPLAGLGVMAAVFGTVSFAVPYFLLSAERLPLAVAATTYIALPFGQTFAAAVGGWAMARWGGWPVALAGAVLTAGGLLAFAPLDAGWSAVDVAWRISVVGLGCGLLAGCNQSVVMALAPLHHEAAASAVSGVLRNLCYAMSAGMAAAAMAVLPALMLALRAAIAGALIVAVAGVLTSLWSRRVMARADVTDHHPLPHATHAALHRLEGLARHDPTHGEYIEPEPLHPRAAPAAAQA